jgi:hypothetical protein
MRAVLGALAMRLRLGRLLRTLLAAAIMGCATWLARRAGLPLGGLIAVSVVGYALCLVLLRVLRIEELVALLRRDTVDIGE